MTISFSGSHPAVSSPGTELHAFQSTYLGERKIDRRFKVVVGIDFGTTFSGVSILNCDNADRIVCGAPGATNAKDESKEPTVLLKTSNDLSGSKTEDGWLFGNAAILEYDRLMNLAQDELLSGTSDETVSDFLRRHGVSMFRHFKMELKNKTQGFHTLEALSTSGDPHNLLDLVTRSLGSLSSFAIREIGKGWLGAAYNVSTENILWVVTVPAIWNDFGKSFMRKAAFMAKMIKNEASSQLLLALEPESASIAVHTEGVALRCSPSLFSRRSSFLLLDIGGGTVDITIHRVVSEAPLVLNEVAEPSGGPWGGTSVDAEFEKFLQQLLGKSVFTELQQHFPFEISEMLDDFRQKKESFGRGSARPVTVKFGGLYTHDVLSFVELAPLSVLAATFNEHSGACIDLSSDRLRARMDRDFTLTLPPELVRSFFEPSLSNICRHVQSLLREHRQVNTLVVVGGYGSSPLVGDRIRSEFGSKNRVVIPDGSMRPQAAILHGAAYFGLNTQVIGARVAKYTLGVKFNSRWTEGSQYSQREASWDDKLQEWRVHDCFETLIRKGDNVAPFQEFSRKGCCSLHKWQRAISFEVYKSTALHPRRVSESGCTQLGTVTVPCESTEDIFDVFFTSGSQLEVQVVNRQDKSRMSTLIEIDSLVRSQTP